MKTVYVVVCFVEGCEDCSNSLNVVGVFSSEECAKRVQKEHEENKKHLHYADVRVEQIQVDVEQPFKCG